MTQMQRRKFLTTVAGGVATAPFIAKSKTKTRGDLPPIPQVALGNTGITTSRMAQGTGFKGTRRQSDQTRAGFEDFVELMQHGYERGIRFFDLADQYGSHYYFREALRYLPREDITILTKMNYRFDDADPTALSPAQQRHSARKAVDRFRLELDIDVLDVVLMHCVVTPDWDSELAGYIEVLQDYKEKGVIKALGMSAHDLRALNRATELDWVKIAFTRINPFGTAMDGTPEEVMPVQRKFKDRGASVVGMKIFGAGKHVDQCSECMKFAQNLGYLDAMTIGARSPKEVDHNIRLMNKYPEA